MGKAPRSHVHTSPSRALGSQSRSCPLRGPWGSGPMGHPREGETADDLPCVPLTTNPGHGPGPPEPEKRSRNVTPDQPLSDGHGQDDVVFGAGNRGLLVAPGLVSTPASPRQAGTSATPRTRSAAACSSSRARPVCTCRPACRGSSSTGPEPARTTCSARPACFHSVLLGLQT